MLRPMPGLRRLHLLGRDSQGQAAGDPPGTAGAMGDHNGPTNGLGEPTAARPHPIGTHRPTKTAGPHQKVKPQAAGGWAVAPAAVPGLPPPPFQLLRLGSRLRYPARSLGLLHISRGGSGQIPGGAGPPANPNAR